MPINPSISLQTKVPDTGQIFSNALLNIQRFDQLKQSRADEPTRQRLLEAQAATAEAGVPSEQAITNQRNLERATSVINAAVQINALPTTASKLAFAKNRRLELIETAKSTGKPANTIDTDSYISQLESGDIVGAQQSIEKTIASGDKLGILRRDPSKQGLASAKTEILDDGSTIQALPSGDVVVRDPSGAIATGQARLDVLKGAREQKLTTEQQEADIAVTTEGRKEKAKLIEQEKALPRIGAKKAAAKQAITKSGKLFDRLEKVNVNIANYDEVIRLLDEGAETGAVTSLFPSFKAATVALENIQGQLGLDVIGNTTFGALSESELKFALRTALPDKLSPENLRRWALRKKSVQQKLSRYLSEATNFLGTPGNTLADWNQLQELNQLDSETPGQTEDLSQLTIEQLTQMREQAK